MLLKDKCICLTCENCKSRVLQDKSNFEIFMSPKTDNYHCMLVLESTSGNLVSSCSVRVPSLTLAIYAN